VDAVGCGTMSALFVFDILQVPTGYIDICGWSIAAAGTPLPVCIKSYPQLLEEGLGKL
jgi:hypothetical protein